MLYINSKADSTPLSKILYSIKTNRLLPLILSIVIIEIIAYNVADMGKWIYNNGYGPISLQDARDIAILAVRFGNTDIFEAFGGQAKGAGAAGLMLFFSVPTLLFVLARIRIISAIGLVAMGLCNLWQLKNYFSDIEKVSGTCFFLMILALCTLCLIIILIIRLLKNSKTSSLSSAVMVCALIVSASSIVSCSQSSKNANDYVFYPIEYQGNKAYMSPDGTISAMAGKDVYGDNVLRDTDGKPLKLEGKNLRVGMKDAVVLHNFWEGSQVVLKISKGENNVDFLFNTRSDTDMGNFSDGVVPVGVWDRNNGNHRLQIMNTSGDLVAELSDIEGDELASCSRFFQDGLLRVKTKSGNTAYLDTKGKVAIPLRDYFKADDFYNGYALVADNPDLWFVINTEGEIVQRYDEGIAVSHYHTPGGFFIMKDSRLYYDDLHGNRYEQPESLNLVGMRDLYYVFRHTDGFGISSYKGEVLLEPMEVSVMLPASENTVVVRRLNGDTELLSLSGESIKNLGHSDGIYMIPPIYGHTTDFGFWLLRGEDCYYYTQKGDQPLDDPVIPLIDDYKHYNNDIIIRK